MSYRNMTIIPKSKQGPPRFGIDENDENRKPGEVITYQLSEEELARYKSIAKPKVKEKMPVIVPDNPHKKAEKELTKDEFIKLKEQGMTDTAIMKEHKMNNVRFYGLKELWGLKGVRIDNLKEKVK